MNTLSKEDHGLTVEGTVYARNRRISNSSFRPIGNTTSLKLKSESETKERTSKMKGSYGSALDTLVTKKPTSLSFSLDTFDRENLAMTLMGDSVKLSDTATTITDKPVNIPKKGEWYSIGIDNLDASTISVKNADDTPLSSDDYVINANVGMIAIQKSCANVTDGQDVKVTGNTRADGGFKIMADTVSSYDLELLIDTRNRLTGREGKLHILSAVVASDGEIDWFGEGFNSASFKGNAVLVDGNQSPYSYTEFN